MLEEEKAIRHEDAAEKACPVNMLGFEMPNRYRLREGRNGVPSVQIHETTRDPFLVRK